MPCAAPVTIATLSLSRMAPLRMLTESSTRAAVEPSPPRSGERVARAQRGPGEGQLARILLQSGQDSARYCPSPASPLSRLGTLSPLRYASRGEGEERAAPGTRIRGLRTGDRETSRRGRGRSVVAGRPGRRMDRRLAGWIVRREPGGG